MMWWRKPKPAPIPKSIQDEISQTLAWWEREFAALNRQVFPPKPFDPAEHEGHSIVREMTYSGRIVYEACTDCRADD